MSKFGLLLLILLFGTLTYSAGVLTPEPLKQSASTAALSLYQQLQALIIPPSQSAQQQEDAAEHSPSQVIAYQDLLYTPSTPTDAALGIQIGLYPSRSDAQSIQQQLQQQGYTSQWLTVSQTDQLLWHILVVGPYRPYDTAKRMQAQLRRLLGYRVPLSIILLPDNAQETAG